MAGADPPSVAARFLLSFPLAPQDLSCLLQLLRGWHIDYHQVQDVRGQQPLAGLFVFYPPGLPLGLLFMLLPLRFSVSLLSLGLPLGRFLLSLLPPPAVAKPAAVTSAPLIEMLYGR